MNKFFFVNFVFIFFLSFSITEALIVPQVYFTEINLAKTNFNPGETIEGTVSLWNYEQFSMNDLVFHFQLLGEEVNGVPTQMIDNQIGKEVFSLSAGEKKTLSFSYQLPQNLPKGNFVFRIQLANIKGEEMSWIEKIIAVGGEGKFLTLENYWIIKDNQKLSPGAGVYYQPGEIPKVEFDVINNTQFTITAFSKIITYKRNVGEQVINEFEGEKIILKPNGKEKIEMELPKLEKPETYLSEIRFYDIESKQPISNSIYFRWIISGTEDAEILFVNPDKDSYKAGEEAKISIQYTGPAHFEKEGEEGKIEIKIFDQKGELVGKREKEIILKPGQEKISVPITRDVENPKIVTTILKGEKALDQYAIQKPLLKEEAKEEPKKMSFFEKNKNLIAISSLIVLLILIIVLFLKKRKIFFFSLFLAGLFFGNYILAATQVTGGCCDTTIVFNSPLPNQTFKKGDLINFSGKFKVTSCGNGLFFNKVTFYVTEDKEIPITDCCGHSQDDCGTAFSCKCDIGCNQCYGATSTSYTSCNFKWCDEVKYLDTTRGYKIYKFGEIYPPDVAQGSKPYWVEYNQNFIIPKNLDFCGPARFYVQYSGTHWDEHWHWNITYQKGRINCPPTASISCDPHLCNSSDCIAYTGCVFTLLNKSTDPDNDIVESKWDIIGWGTDEDLVCTTSTNPLCNFTIPTNLLTPGTYTVKLEVKDSAGEVSSATITFSLLRDAVADFLCSSDNQNWKNCEEIKPFRNQKIYLKDISTPSEGATKIVKRTWKINGNVFDSDNNENPSVNLPEHSNVIELEIVDDKGRTAKNAHTISTLLPLPWWREIPPTIWLEKFLTSISSFFLKPGL